MSKENKYKKTFYYGTTTKTIGAGKDAIDYYVKGNTTALKNLLSDTKVNILLYIKENSIYKDIIEIAPSPEYLAKVEDCRNSVYNINQNLIRTIIQSSKQNTENIPKRFSNGDYILYCTKDYFNRLEDFCFDNIIINNDLEFDGLIINRDLKFKIFIDNFATFISPQVDIKCIIPTKQEINNETYIIRAKE